MRKRDTDTESVTWFTENSFSHMCGQVPTPLTLLSPPQLFLHYGVIRYFRTTTNGRGGGLLAGTGSFSGHPSKQQPLSVA
ncbi:hypothetical protein J6590_068031 [Homalodisca vitripennis]|nr:hypothetical protein J6590_068031 [Homalodisca vitripennis]